MFTVVTSFSQRGWNAYAHAFVDSFYAHFPEDVALLAYWEGATPEYGGWLPGYDLLSIQPCAAFLGRHVSNEIVQGKIEGRAAWGPKARREGYSYRHNAFKFARKVFAVADAARRVGRGRLFWIDADVVVETQVPRDLLINLLPGSVSLCYLARNRFHSECGFVGYNLDRLETRAFITAYEAEYAEDKFLNRPHWDDCSVLDALVKERNPSVKPIAHTDRAQPFDHSILGQYMTHLKGKRKVAA